MKKAKELGLTEAAKRAIRNVIDKNRELGGKAWKDYSHDELMEIYGYLPHWAVENS